MTRTLAVIGAINVDLVVSGVPLPAPGQTVTGGSFARHDGGKGGNQAVAAARALGSGSGAGEVAVIGAVGSDGFGDVAVEAIVAEGIRPFVTRLDGVPTGVALIAVDADGENQISVAPGANGRVSPEQVERELASIRPALVLMSLEIPASAVAAAAAWCSAHDVPVVLNPAPAQPWTQTVLPHAAYVTPNEGELELLGPVPDGVTLIATRGAGGVRIAGDPPVEVPAPRVNVVDTTGAGDCFNGVLAASLLEGLPLVRAVRRAAVAAAMSTTRAGARDGMPARAEIDRAMREDQSSAE